MERIIVSIEFKSTATATAVSGTLTCPAKGYIQVDAGTTLTILAGGILSNTGPDIIIYGTISNSGTINATSGTFNVQGTANNSGTINGSAGNLLFAPGSNYNHIQDGGIIPTATWYATSNCNITSLISTPIAGGLNQTFGNMTVNCPGLTSPVTLTTSGNVTVAGSLSIQGTSAVNTLTFNPSNFTFSVTGTTTINNYGILLLAYNGGANTFNGLITLNNSGSWNSTGITSQPALNINAGFTLSAGSTGTVNMGAGNISALTLNSGLFNVALAGGTFVVTGSTIIKGGTLNFAPTLAGSSGSFSGPITLSSGSFTVGSTVAATLTVNGFTKISGGTFNITTDNCTCTFNDTIVLGSSGSWTSTALHSPANLIIKSSILNYGSGGFIADAATFSTNNISVLVNTTGNITFGGSGGNLDINTGTTIQGTGTGNFSFLGTGTMTIATGVTLTNSRQSNIYGILTGASGTSVFLNTNSGYLKYYNTTIPMATGIMNLNSPGNTVEYAGNGVSQNINPVPTYNNLVISGGGIKSLTGATSLDSTGTLTLKSGILEAGNFNLTVQNTSHKAIQGSFSSSCMFATDGTGYLKWSCAAGKSYSFPIGSITLSDYYSPVTISPEAFSAISLRAVYDSTGTNFINVYFDVQSSSATNITSTFQFDPAEANGVSGNCTVWYKTPGGSWGTPPPTGIPGYGLNNSFTITGTTSILPVNTSTYWTAGKNSCSANFGYNMNSTRDTVFFTDNSTGTGGINKWFWDFGNGETSNQKNVALKVSPGVYNVLLSAKGLYGCTASTTQSVVVTGTGNVCNDVADFSYSLDSGTFQVNFSNTSQGSGISFFNWNFGNGKISVQPDPVNIYAGSGSYAVTLSICDSAEQCISTVTKNVAVGTVNCSAAFTYFSDSTSVYFTNTSIGTATNLNWFFGDGGQSSEMNPVHIFPAQGYYTVELYVYSSVTNCMDFYEQTILTGKTGNDCKAEFSYFSNLTRDSSIIFENKSPETNIKSFLWNFGDSRTASTENISHHYSDSGYFSVCFTITDSSNCSNTNCKAIKVGGSKEDCYIRFIYSVDTATGNVLFKDKSLGGPNIFSWYFGTAANDSSHVENPSFTFPGSGFYPVRLNAITPSGCRGEYLQVLNINGGDSIKCAFMMKEQGNLEILEKIEEGPYSVSISNLEDNRQKSVSFAGASFGVRPNIFGILVMEQLIQLLWIPLTPMQIMVLMRYALLYLTRLQEDKTPSCNQIEITNVAIPSHSLNGFNIETFPNPMSRFTNIQYSLNTESNINIVLYDALGVVVSEILNGNRQAGNYNVIWDRNTLPSGMYFLRMRTGQTSKTIILSVIE